MTLGLPLFAFIPIMLGVGFIIAGATTRSSSKNWHSTQGEVTPGRFGLDLRRGMSFHWRGPDGVVRNGKGLTRTWIKTEGTPVTVLYDPQDFNRFRLEVDRSAGTAFFILGWVVFALGVLAFIVLLTALVIFG